MSPEWIERLKAVRDRIKSNWSLCEFMGNCEKEYMVAETIHAACINMETHGEPFSFRGDNVFATHGNGLVRNGPAFEYLVHEGFFQQSMRLDRPAIFPTPKLIARLEEFFAAKAVA